MLKLVAVALITFIVVLIGLLAGQFTKVVAASWLVCTNIVIYREKKVQIQGTCDIDWNSN